MTVVQSPSHSRQVLQEAPGRALTFLGAVYRRREIRAALEERGYTPEAHAEGWTRLHAAQGFMPGTPLPILDEKIRDAVVAIDQWDEPNFAIARATLTHRYPDQADFVFAGLSASQSTAAVVGVDLFLTRLNALEAGREGRDEAGKAADCEALKLLAQRGIDAAERARLAALVAVAEGKGEAPSPLFVEKSAPDDTAALESLKSWFDEWSSIARAVVKKRQHLILLGLAKKRVVKKPVASSEQSV